MASGPIDELNQGLRTFEAALRNDPTTCASVQLAMVVVGGPGNHSGLMMDWTNAAEYQAFELAAAGEAPLGKGLLEALRIVEERKHAYWENGISYARPRIVAISAGAPTDDDATWQEAVRSCRTAEREKKCIIHPVAVGGTNARQLQQISTVRALRLSEFSFTELFQWSEEGMDWEPEDEGIPLPSTEAWTAEKP